MPNFGRQVSPYPPFLLSNPPPFENPLDLADINVPQPINPPKPDLSNALPELYPEPHDIPQGWGLTFFLHLRDSAVHSEGTGWWAGLPNLFWWADRKRVSYLRFPPIEYYSLLSSDR